MIGNAGPISHRDLKNAKMCCALLYYIYIIFCWSVLIILSLL